MHVQWGGRELFDYIYILLFPESRFYVPAPALPELWCRHEQNLTRIRGIRKSQIILRSLLLLSLSYLLLSCVHVYFYTIAALNILQRNTNVKE